MDASRISEIVALEIAAVSQGELIDAMRQCLVPPRLEQREWDYSKESTRHPCWIVLEHRGSNTCIAYCEQGFGPNEPWGLLSISGNDASMGMDDRWYSRLEDCFRVSPAWDGPNPQGYEVR